MADNQAQDGKLHGDRSIAGAAAGGQANAAEAARQGAAALQQGGRVAGDAARRGYEASADIARQGTQAGVDTMRRMGEAAKVVAHQGTQVMTEGQRQIAATTARTFQDVGRKVAQAAQGTSEEMRRLAALPRAAEGGLHDMQHGMAGLFAGIAQANLRATQELFRLANPVAVIELQQQFVRECMDTSMRGTATLLQAVRRTADEILHPLQVQIDQRQGSGRDHGTAV